MKNVVIYCGPSLEPWNPNSLGQGIGGSESSCIHVSRELSKLGFEVTVYNQTRADDVFDGVHYIPFEKVKPFTCDTLIVWRSPELLTSPDHLLNKVTARKKILWLHDLLPEAEVLPYVFLFDTFVVQTHFHREQYPSIAEDKFSFIKAATDTIPSTLPRDPWKLVSASNYDRGIVHLLQNWTYFKLRYPELTLTIMYGWETLAGLAQDPKAFEWFKSYMENLFNQEGITHLGRVSNERVLEEMSTAQLWVYPAIWPETACIVAMQAQAMGAVPVVIPKAALKETVIGGFLADSVPEFFERLEYALTHPEEVEEIREGISKTARKRYSWKEVAKAWESILTA